MQEIDTVPREFMNRKALFTSIDIANEVKRRGTWIPNRDVAAGVRRPLPVGPEPTPADGRHFDESNGNRGSALGDGQRVGGEA